MNEKRKETVIYTVDVLFRAKSERQQRWQCWTDCQKVKN